jgi:23S rRNA (cytosine1962-C5)-methyltransferase
MRVEAARAMDRTRLWPDFRDAWILHEDADLIAIQKPEGVPSQAADPDRPDDVVTRLSRFLEARGSDGYLGVHQRLDRDTSGVLVYARRREANKSLATQFERRGVEKTYVACVRGWPAKRGRVTLRDTVAPDDRGGMRVLPPRAGRGRGGVEAVTHVKELSRHGDRVCLELTLETGRTHQARVQLAHAGAAVAGDPLYGGPPAPRLMLHARALALLHPTTGRRRRVESPLPADFDVWLARGDLGEGIYDDVEALDRALRRALERRWGLGRAASGARATTAFRLLNEEGDATPRLAVDVYGDWLVAQVHAGDGPWSDASRQEGVLDALAGLGFDGVYLKVRPKQANVLVDTRREEVAPRLPVRGVAAPDEIEILEEGCPNLVRLGDGLSTGLFLDQRDNRRRLRGVASGQSVANLFAYTCGFSLAAALGGARRTVSVDASVAALERGRAGFVHAGVLDEAAHTFVAMDAFAWLERADKRKELFDIVVLDPPSYSALKRGARFVADKDYAGLAAAALRILGPRGRLLACTNHRGISPARFRKILFDAARAAKREVAQVKDLASPSDFPEAPGAEPHTKSALVTLASGAD